MDENSAYRLDKKKTRLGFERAADTYDEAAVLQREIGERLLERLDYVRLEPSRVLDLGCGTGQITAQLMKRYPKAIPYSLDIALSMTKKALQHGGWFRKPKAICASADALPIRDDCIDIMLSNLMLQWCDDLVQVFAGLNRVLSSEGLFMFTTFGPDTLKELRQSWHQVDGYTHTSQFVDMHDVGDALLQSGFSQPVVDMETITMTYPSVRALMKDLKQIGASNATAGRNHGLTGKQRIRKLEEAYQQYRLDDGSYPATYEVIYGHAWAGKGVGLDREIEGVEKYIPIVPE
jgi:malonyl-CoA O-methyltransferase